MSHWVGSGVQLPSMPFVIVSLPEPAPFGLCQPSPIASIGAISGGGPISLAGTMPWLLPKAWPPAISATVSSLFIAMRLKVDPDVVAPRPCGSPLA